jgi:two-component system LytT family response regulator
MIKNASSNMVCPLTAILADDEPLPRLHLRLQLEQQGVTILGEAENATSALQQLTELRPDILFLDIQMPSLSGIQLAGLLQNTGKAPLVIFVTGYSEYAVEAFDRAAFDYLLKPTTSERVARTLLRVRQYLETTASPREEVREESLPLPSGTPLQRIPVRSNYSLRFVRVEEVDYIEARQKAVYLHLLSSVHSEEENKELRLTYSLSQLEKLLPTEFVRIHDSYIVPLNRIEELLFLGNHSYAIRLSGGQTLPVGRSRYGLLRERLGLQPGGETL